MNKKIIAVAIAAVVAAPAAFAGDTTMYGKAHVSVNYADMGAGDMWSVNSNASRWGVKGSEDLGNGLKAVFKYEVGYDVTDGGAFGGARNSYVGLSGDFGTVLAGRHDTPAKVAFYGAGNEHLGDSIIDLNGGFGFTEVRASNATAYISPSMSGLTVAAAMVAGEGATATATNLNDAYSLGAMYSGNGLKASVGYEVFTSDLTGGNDQTMIQAGVSYTMDAFTVGGQYQNTSDIGGGTAEADVWAVSGKYNMGNSFLVATYGENDTLTGGNLIETIGVGVGQKLSKRSQVYVAYRNQTQTGAADVDMFSLGMVHNF